MARNGVWKISQRQHLTGPAFKRFRQSKKYKKKEKQLQNIFFVLFLQHDNCVSSKALEEQSCRWRRAVCYAPTSIRDTLSGLIQHGETEPNTHEKRFKSGILRRFTFCPAHCVDEDVVLVDLVLVMLKFLPQGQQLLVGKLSGAFGLLDR